MLSNDIRTMIPPPQSATHPTGHPSAHGGGPRDYTKNPVNVYWEMTQACSLACRHCRAEAMPLPQSDQLTTSDSKTLLRQIAGFTPPLPHLILTGGDPLERTDIFELIDEAKRIGLTVSITPSATPKLTFDKMAELKEHGIENLGLSLDGSTPERHEAVRGVQGCFDRTIEALESAAKLGMPVQVNTLVAEETLDDLPAIYELLKGYKLMRWSLFYLVTVGRGRTLHPITPEQGERTMEWVFDLTQIAPFLIGTTEAPSYRRVALRRMREMGWPAAKIKSTGVYRGFGIRDGNGIVFVSNQGHVSPAGFLPLVAGNVRQDHLVEIYRDSPLFRALHAPSGFHGKCGFCEYSAICGGSRARAFAETGDPLASDPFCVYDPAIGSQDFVSVEQLVSR